jgi:hypothetical protein
MWQVATKGVLLVCVGVRVTTSEGRVIEITALEPANFYRVQRSRAMDGEAPLISLLGASKHPVVFCDDAHLPALPLTPVLSSLYFHRFVEQCASSTSCTQVEVQV